MGVDGHVTFCCTNPTQAQIFYSFRNATLDHLLCFANYCGWLVVHFASTHLSYELCWVSPWGNIKCGSCMKAREWRQKIWNESAKSLMLCLNTVKWQLKLCSLGSKFWTYVPRTYDDFLSSVTLLLLNLFTPGFYSSNICLLCLTISNYPDHNNPDSNITPLFVVCFCLHVPKSKRIILRIF